VHTLAARAQFGVQQSCRPACGFGFGLASVNPLPHSGFEHDFAE
jgi:hypothetical protein